MKPGLSIRKPEGALAWFAAIWLLSGAAGAFYFAAKGTLTGLVLGLVSAVVAIMAAGLWLGWSWIRLPFTIYWGVIAACGIALLFLKPVTIEAVGQVLLAAYFAFLVYYWDPEEREFTELKLNS